MYAPTPLDRRKEGISDVLLFICREDQVRAMQKIGDINVNTINVLRAGYMIENFIDPLCTNQIKVIYVVFRIS